MYIIKFDVLIDTISNQFHNIYGSWPARAYIINNNKLKWILQPRIGGYYAIGDVKEGVEQFLQNL